MSELLHNVFAGGRVYSLVDLGWPCNYSILCRLAEAAPSSVDLTRLPLGRPSLSSGMAGMPYPGPLIGPTRRVRGGWGRGQRLGKNLTPEGQGQSKTCSEPLTGPGPALGDTSAAW